MATTTPPARSEPETPVDGDVLYEVIDGRIVEKVMGSYATRLASVLQEVLGPFARANRLGIVVTEMLFWLDQASKLQRRPDVAFVSFERWPRGRKLPETAPWDVIPDLAVEIVSPSNTAAEVQGKVHEYFRAGVRRVWVIYPKTAEVYLYDSPASVQILAQGSEIDGAPLLPGFRLPVATLFEDEAG